MSNPSINSDAPTRAGYCSLGNSRNAFDIHICCIGINQERKSLLLNLFEGSSLRISGASTGSDAMCNELAKYVDIYSDHDKGFLMLRDFLTVFALAALPAFAFAHGEDVLVTLYAELLTIITIILALRMVPAFRRYWRGGSAFCILGVIAAWLVTWRLPYRDNQHLITALSVALPLLATAAYVIWRRRRTR